MQIKLKRYGLLCGGLFMLSSLCNGQPCRCNVPVISSKAAFAEAVARDPGKKMVSLQVLIPGLVADLRYATSNNFTHTILYRQKAIACMRQEPAKALLQVQQELRKKGLGLKIFDAYRPFSVTCQIWRQVPDKHYAANPAKGSHHNQGIAVDLTLIDLKTGKELDMGTGFDNFTDSAHHDFTKLTPNVLANRQLLKNVMWKYGFNFVPNEWWHYHWRQKAGYEVLDLGFDDVLSVK